MPAASEPRRRRRRKAGATGHVRVAWRAKGADVGHEVPPARRHRVDADASAPRMGQAEPQDAKGWLPRRGRPPEGTLNEDAARSCAAGVPRSADRADTARADQLERCADAFLESCREKRRSPTTLRTYKQIVGELKARWQGWRAVDVDADELEDYRDELAERGLAGEHAQPAPRRAVGHLQDRAPAVPGQRRPDRRLRARRGQATPAIWRSTASRRSGRWSVPPAPALTTPARRLHAHARSRPPGAHSRAAVYR